MKGLSIVIPVFNEENEVGKVIDKLLALPLDKNQTEIIIVDDASTDGTFKVIASKAGITVFANEKNSGYGASLKKGILNAKYDKIAICDSDNTYPVQDIPKLVELFEGNDMVVGRRKIIRYPQYNWLKQIGRATLDLLCSYLSGSWIPDINSGLRIFKKEIALKNIDLLCDRFSFTTSITLIVFSQKGKVLYKDIDYCIEETHRNSKVKILSDGWKTMLLILRHGIIHHLFKVLLLFVAIIIFVLVVCGFAIK